jgi:hypothetical protein
MDGTTANSTDPTQEGKAPPPIAAWVLLLVTLGCAGQDPGGASTWVGHTYFATPADPYTYLTRPKNSEVADVMANFIPNFLLRVNGVSNNEVAITVAPAKRQTEPPEQDLCNVTKDVSAEVSGYPNIRIGPTDFPLFLTTPPTKKTQVTAKATVHAFSLSDVLPQGAEPSEAGRFSALVDVREVSSLVTVLEGASPEEMCETFKSKYATECVACPDSQVLCLLFESQEFGATETATSVRSMSESDLDPSCPKP